MSSFSVVFDFGASIVRQTCHSSLPSDVPTVIRAFTEICWDWGIGNLNNFKVVKTLLTAQPNELQKEFEHKS